ncbi:MAG: hypothetical protein V5B78_09190, partial [Desulfohalobiaceae bacterium]
MPCRPLQGTRPSLGSASAGLRQARLACAFPRGNGPPRGMSRTSSDRRERAVNAFFFTHPQF